MQTEFTFTPVVQASSRGLGVRTTKSLPFITCRSALQSMPLVGASLGHGAGLQVLVAYLSSQASVALYPIALGLNDLFSHLHLNLIVKFKTMELGCSRSWW